MTDRSQQPYKEKSSDNVKFNCEDMLQQHHSLSQPLAILQDMIAIISVKHINMNLFGCKECSIKIPRCQVSELVCVSDENDDVEVDSSIQQLENEDKTVASKQPNLELSQQEEKSKQEQLNGNHMDSDDFKI